MFFANPVAALGNVRRSLVPGGRLVMVIWRAKVANDWLYRAQAITERFVAKPEQYDAPTCGPGPFSMANANTTSGVLKSAGCEEITLRRCDLPITIGRDIDEAVKFVMDVGPAGEILRLAAARAAHLHKPVADALREGLADWAGSDGVIAPLIDMDRHRQHPRRSRTLLMLARFRSRLTFANVVSLMALFVALGGGAYAMTIAKDSVGATQLNRNADTRSKWRFVAAREGSL